MHSVSVIVPCYNGAATLARAIESCLAQREAREILIVDDGSTDSSASVARSFTMREPRVRLLQLPDRGGGARARNWGALHASGTLLALLDATDEYLPHALTAPVAHLVNQTREAAIRLEVEYAGFPERFADHPNFAREAAALSNTLPGSLVIRRGAYLALGGLPVDPVFRRYGGDCAAFSWALHEIYGQRRLVDEKRVRVHYRAGSYAERLLNVRLGLMEPDADGIEATLRAARMFLETARAQVQALRTLRLR
jgi:glycosyltransferase involved in cell wall biosynthesis